MRNYTSKELDEMEAVNELYVCPTCDTHGHQDDFGEVCPHCECELEDDQKI